MQYRESDRGLARAEEAARRRGVFGRERHDRLPVDRRARGVEAEHEREADAADAHVAEVGAVWLGALSFGGWWLQSILLKSLMGQGAVVFAAVGGA